jgi:biotin operon repressor
LFLVSLKTSEGVLFVGGIGSTKERRIMRDGYAICFNEWALDKDINGELGLLLIISSLCCETGYCYASNEYLAELFNTTEITISRKIRKLKDKGYLTIDYEKRGAEVKKRFIRLTRLLTDDYQNCKPTINKNVKENNISINNTSINNKEIYKERFKKPTLEEVEEYCRQRNSSVDARTFYEYFETGGWVDSKGNKVKNWKQKIITWENHRQPKENDVPKWFNEEQKEEELSEEDRRLFDTLLES